MSRHTPGPLTVRLEYSHPHISSARSTTLTCNGDRISIGAVRAALERDAGEQHPFGAIWVRSGPGLGGGWCKITADLPLASVLELRLDPPATPMSREIFKLRKWTPEQVAVIELARAPNTSGPGRIVRCTSGAGTGKTSTIEGAAMQLVLLGHEKVMYLAFNRVCATEASRRLKALPIQSGCISAHTVHGAAFRLCPPRSGSAADAENSALSDDSLDLKLHELLKEELDEKLRDVEPEQRTRARRRMLTYVRKTLDLFVRSAKTVERGLAHKGDAWRFNTYFPCILWHKERLPEGIDPLLPQKGWYVQCAARAWGKMGCSPPDFFTFDSVVKQAQLACARLQGVSALLVDESQDLSEAQLSWLSAQALDPGVHRQSTASKAGCDVFFVGDAAQTIYSFRGAKSTALARLGDPRASTRWMEPQAILQAEPPEVIDAALTCSFRFGHEIAACANALLFSKRHSAQTHADPAYSTWKPYTISGASPTPGRVTSSSLIQARIWERGQRLTVIGRSNAALLGAALEILHCADEGGPLPAIGLLGDGENAGKGKWQTALREVGHFLDLFLGKTNSLPVGPWKADAAEARESGRPPALLTWAGVRKDVEDLELKQFTMYLSLIEEHRECLSGLLATFERDVLKRDVSEAEADVLLSTTHQAKGREWPHVQVLADFGPLARWVVGRGAGLRGELDWPKSQADELNLWYVACTRAQETLSVPPSVRTWHADMLVLGQAADAVAQGAAGAGAAGSSMPEQARTPTKRQHAAVEGGAAALGVSPSAAHGSGDADAPSTPLTKARRTSDALERSSPSPRRGALVPRALASPLGSPSGPIIASQETEPTSSPQPSTPQLPMLTLGESKWERCFNQEEVDALHSDLFLRWKEVEAAHGQLHIEASPSTPQGAPAL